MTTDNRPDMNQELVFVAEYLRLQTQLKFAVVCRLALSNSMNEHMAFAGMGQMPAVRIEPSIEEFIVESRKHVT